MHASMKWFGVILVVLCLTGCKFGTSKSDSLFIYTSLEEEIAKNLFEAFKNETKIPVQFVRLSTGEAAARIEAEQKNPQASLWIGGVGLGHAELKTKNLTQSYRSPETTTLPLQYYDPDYYWSGIYLGILAFASNEKKLKEFNLQAPESWHDILKPQFKDKIQIANPGTSGTSYNLITTLIAKWGEEKAFDYLKKLHNNISQYTRSGAAPTKNVALGESVVAVGFAHDMIRLVQESHAPLKITYPVEGTGYELAAMSILKGAPQLDLAKKLYDWMYSRTASQILSDHYIVPLKKKDIQLKKESLNPDILQLIHTDIEWAGKNKQRLIEMWNEKINS